MKKCTLSILFCISCFAPIFPNASDQPVKANSAVLTSATKERMAVLELLMNKSLILTFVSHPKTMEYFLHEKQGIEDYMRSFRPKFDRLRRQYPSDSEVIAGCSWFSHLLDRIDNPLPYQEIVIPFFAWGITNLNGINDPGVVRDIQDLQVQLFKNYLAREGIGSTDDELTQKIAAFSNRSSLPIFSKIIRPVTQNLLQHESDIDFLVEIYSGGDERELLSDTQSRKLEAIYDPAKYAKPVIDLPEFSWKLDDKLFEDLFSEDSEYLDEEDSPGEKALDALLEDIKSQRFFSRNDMIKLFFEVIIESYPQHKEFFQEVQRNNNCR